MAHRLSVYLFLGVMAVSFSVHAQNVSDVLPSGEEERVDALKVQNDILTERVANVVNGLKQQEIVHFMAMYANYNIYSMVKSVRDDVSQAAQGCAENNPELKRGVTSKFSNWDRVVGARLKESLANIETLSLAQNYLSQANVKAIFAQVDKVRSINSSRFETTPVTTPEACEFMMSKMDETQEQMVQLLQSTLQSYPNLLRQNQQ